MRKLIAAATFMLSLAVAGAAGAASDEQSPEGRVYFGASFGGERVVPRNLHYGLRLDHDSRFLEGASVSPPLMHLDFTRRGLNDARVNGLSVLKRQYRMKQDDGETVEEDLEAEEPGLLEGMWNGVTGFFGGLFGDDEEEQVAEAEEEVVEEAEEAPEDLAEGAFMGYSAVDWGLLAVGAVGVGFIASEVVNGEEDPDPTAGSGTGGNGDGGVDPCDPDTFDPETCLGGLGLASITASRDDLTQERLEWLDSGTGQMGDLHEQRRN